MKRKFRLLMLLTVLTAMVGIFNSCGEETGGEDPTPVNPTPNDNADKPTPDSENAAQKAYEEAFQILKESHNYDQAVAKLQEAADANVDSASLTLAYMYEYGVGVEQDIAKAKELYAKEAELNGNEFAADKIMSLEGKDINFEIVLPEKCELNMNEVLLFCGDTIAMANGDGAFKASSNVVVARNAENKIVGICYKHSSSTEVQKLDALGTAVTLMMFGIPHAFETDKRTYDLIRSQILALEETHLLAEEIERQLVAGGGFDYVSLAPFITEGCDAIYSAYADNKQIQSKNGTVEQGVLAEENDFLHYLYTISGQRINLAPELRNDVRTSIKTGTYNNDSNVWNITVNVKNMSSLPFLALPGVYDGNEFHAKDFFENFRFIHSNSDVVDFGGSFTMMLRNQLNYFRCVWDVIYNDEYSKSESFFGGIHEMISISGVAQKEYREKYMSVEEDIELEIGTGMDALRYYFPFCGNTTNDLLADAYYIVYNLAIPAYDNYSKLISSKNTAEDSNIGTQVDKKLVKKIAKEACISLVKDQEWMSQVTIMFNKIRAKGFVSWATSDDFKKFAEKTYDAILETVWSQVVEAYSYNSTDKQINRDTKAGKESYKLAKKLYQNGADANKVWDVVSSVEKVFIDDLPGPKEILKTANIANSCAGLIVGLVDRFGLDYNSFDIRFAVTDGESPSEIDDTPHSINLSQGLVAYYPFDNDADDYSGNGNNGTPTNISFESGIKGDACLFHGVDNPSWIQIPNSSSLQFDEAASFSMWFNVSSYRGQDGWASTVDYGDLKLFSKDYDRGEIFGSVYGIDANKYAVGLWGICNVRDNCGAEFDGNIINQWNHIVFVATTHYLKIYLNGELIDTKEYESSFSASNTQDLYIGRLNSYYAYYFNGLIDDFRVYNRELNSAEVAELYNIH